MTNFSLNSKNPTFDLFLADFPIFGDKKCFPEKSDIHNLTRFSSTTAKFRET